MGKDLFEKRKLEFIKFIQDKQRLPEAWEVSFSDGEDMHVWFNKLPEIPKFKVFKEEINKILSEYNQKILNCIIKTIKEIFLENPKILDMTINEFDNIVKFIKGEYYG